MDDSTQRDVDALAGGLEEQRRLYLDMEALAARQREVLAADDHAALAQLLAGKQAILDRVGEVEARIAGVKARWKELREQVGAPRRAEVERLVDEVGEVLRRLMSFEAEGRATLEARRRDTAEQIQKVWKTRQLPKAYRPPPAAGGEPRFFDGNR